MANTVNDMQVFLMGLHDKNTFSCKNLDQLPSLWAAFTKCKQNIRDGFRLENMSWRLWYREAMMKKRINTEASVYLPESSTQLMLTKKEEEEKDTMMKNKKKMVQDDTILFDQHYKLKTALLSFNHPTSLVRSQSLPSLSQHHQYQNDIFNQQNNKNMNNKINYSLPVTRRSSATTTPDHSSSTPLIKSSKFYIDYHDDSEDEQEEEGEEGDDLFESFNEEYNDDDDDDNHSYSSSDSSIASYNDQPPMIKSKPVSLLTHLLRKESSPTTTTTLSNPSKNGLKRCQCYGRLDQWFLASVSS
ncbi:unnamed protein product [Cunninghamella blakesleeana]